MPYTVFNRADEDGPVEQGLEIEDAFDTLLSMARLYRTFRRRLGIMALYLNPLSPRAPRDLPVITSNNPDDREAEDQIKRVLVDKTIRRGGFQQNGVGAKG